MAPATDILLFLLIAIGALVLGYLIRQLLIGGRELRKLSGRMLVTCPETHSSASVKVASALAAAAAMTGKQHIALRQCSRWPEREGCDQACLEELISDPENHAVWTIASKWYQGKSCSFCGRPISPLSHLDHDPGLVAFNGKILEWKQLPAEQLPEILESGRPVCWNCTVVESFRKEHPELIVERPWKHEH